jgi:hypothetical protein
MCQWLRVRVRALLGPLRPPPSATARFVCAGLYVLAPVNTNECAPSSTRITTVDVCRAAAAALGRTFGVSGTFVSVPRGCYSLTTSGAVLFNAHATGAAGADKQLVCYTGTPAPTNVGDTNPPTRAPTRLPTWGPNFADPSGTTDARAVIAPSPHSVCTVPRCAPCVVLGPPCFVFQHGTLTARRRALAVHGTTCKPTERVLSRSPASAPYWRVRRRCRAPPSRVRVCGTPCTGALPHAHATATLGTDCAA